MKVLTSSSMRARSSSLSAFHSGHLERSMFRQLSGKGCSTRSRRRGCRRVSNRMVVDAIQSVPSLLDRLAVGGNARRMTPSDTAADRAPPGPSAPPGPRPPEVADRVAKGQVNNVPEAPSRTMSEIIRANLFTKFNALMGSLFAIVIICNSPKDGLFGGVIVANTLIGIIQELRAKRTLDRLTVVNAPKVNALRDGNVAQLAVNELVMDDVIDLLPGQQIVADSTVVVATNLEVDESLLTGEADPIVKQPGDDLLSGSFVVAGSGRGQVSKVGADAYAARLAEEARKFTLVHSDLRAAIYRIVTLVTYALVPTGIALFISQLTGDSETIRESLVSAVGGVVAMVPEGLILLTSV